MQSIEEADAPISALYRFRSSRKLVVVVLCIAAALDGLFYSIIIPIIPAYVESLSLSQTYVGALFSSFSVSLLIATALFGTVADQFGRKV